MGAGLFVHDLHARASAACIFTVQSACCVQWVLHAIPRCNCAIHIGIGPKQFRHAISIVANNDLKSEICKRGAAQYARDTGQPILWCQADDRATEKSGLLDDTSLRTRKLAWLSKHAKDTGGLFGMLPLVRGTPVHLTTHIDRTLIAQRKPY